MQEDKNKIHKYSAKKNSFRTECFSVFKKKCEKQVDTLMPNAAMSILKNLRNVKREIPLNAFLW